jgi:hypothetical protein
MYSFGAFTENNLFSVFSVFSGPSQPWAFAPVSR